MARVACRACGLDERVDWAGTCGCPSCGLSDVRMALAVEELPPEAVERMLRSLDEGREDIAAAA